MNTKTAILLISWIEQITTMLLCQGNAFPHDQLEDLHYKMMSLIESIKDDGGLE